MVFDMYSKVKQIGFNIKKLRSVKAAFDLICRRCPNSRATIDIWKTHMNNTYQVTSHMKIEQNLQINAPVETAYKAVASLQGIRGWWSKNSAVSESVGGTHHLHFVKEEQTVSMHFEVKELLANERVVWVCTANDNPAWVDTLLTFELEKSGGGVAFRLLHDNFDQSWEGAPPFEATVQGWGVFLNSLKMYCESGNGQPM